ncbi:MAG TPA: pyridoxamine 5'-phosphate oxidase family protein [Gaiellaceae bacterium]|nr:pyridoxamine 5'-phosphate oxidase family protein [Gaiellaceae bacterium]
MGREELLDLTTATKRNALTPEEREEFLLRKLVGRLATQRSDGWPHVTPIWYVWEDGCFRLSLGNSRRHLANIRYDPHVTMCVDVDPRVDDPTLTPRSVVCFGTAELVEDEARVREFTEKLELRYLGAVPPEFEEALWFEGRTMVVITPVRWLAWDQSKASG